MLFKILDSVCYEKISVNRYREERDRYRPEEKNRGRERDRRDRDYEPDRERHERYDRHSVDRKRLRKSQSPLRPKSRTDAKDQTPEKGKRKEKDHEDKSEEKKKEKKIKDKKKKKDADEKEKKKKKKKEKKAAQKEAAKDEALKVNEMEIPSIEEKIEIPMIEAKPEPLENQIENIVPEKVCEEAPIPVLKQEFDKKSLAINPEPPEFAESTPECPEEPEFGANPPNPNFKPIPELKPETEPVDSLYGGLDDTEIKTLVTEKYSLVMETEPVEEPERVEVEKSPKKDEFLAPVPELSKWERDETTERSDSVPESPKDKSSTDEPKTTKVVTSEVLKRAENAIFQKAINAIRPIEIKKISESRKILYQNPEPKILEPEPPRKSVNVTINVGRNERNVEITEPVKKAKLDRSKFKPVPESHSPTRLSAKERLGDKVEDEKEKKIVTPKGFLDRHESKTENSSRSRSPRSGRDRRISPLMERRIDPPPSIPNPERKVFLDERKRDRDRSDRPRDRNESRNERHESRSDRNESRGERESRVERSDFRTGRNESRSERNDRDRDRDRKTRTPPIANKRDDSAKMSIAKRKEEEEDKKREKKLKDERKRKKEHRSRSKSKDRKKRKEKKHKKDKEKVQDKKQKHKDEIVSKEKIQATTAVKPPFENVVVPQPTEVKKQRKNPRLVSDRKRSVLDEASFEPDYSATDSESEGDDTKVVHTAAKKVKPEVPEPQKEPEPKLLKKRIRSTSTEDDSSSSESSSSESDSSDESPKRKKRKHKKHKKRKSAKKESTTDSDTNSDSSDSSSDDDKHKKKSKKSKSKNKPSKKKKKTKHK